MGRGGEEGWKVSGGARGSFSKQGQARTTGRREGPRRPQAGQGPGYPGQTSPNGIGRVMGKKPWSEWEGTEASGPRECPEPKDWTLSRRATLKS